MNTSQEQLSFIPLQLMGIHFYFIRIKQNLYRCMEVTNQNLQVPFIIIRFHFLIILHSFLVYELS